MARKPRKQEIERIERGLLSDVQRTDEFLVERIPQTTTPSFAQAIELAPKLVATVTVAILLFSVMHEAGYFSVLGTQLQTLASTYDYFVNALLWVPATFWVIFYLWSANNIINETIAGEASISLFIQLAFCVIGLLFLFFSGGSVAWTVALLFTFLMTWAAAMVPWLIDSPLTKERWYRFFVLFVAGLIMAFGYGAYAATADLRNTSEVYRLVMKEQTDPRQVVVLRGFDKGVLFHDYVNARVEFVRWDAVSSLARQATRSSSISHACRYMSIFCPAGFPPNP